MSNVFIVDVNQTLYRMYSVKPPVVNSSGNRIETLTSVLSYFKNLHQKGVNGTLAEKIIAVSDSNDVDEVRKLISSNYKSDRKGMAPELKQQEDITHDALRAIGVACVNAPGIEADDLMGIIAKKYVSNGSSVYIISNDKDVFQLIGGGIKVYNPITKVLFGEEETKEKFGVNPHQISDYLALVGDRSDGIAGVDGVGSKKAAALLAKYHDVDGVISAAQAGDIKGVMGEKIRLSIDVVRQSKVLATLINDGSYLTDEMYDEICGASYNIDKSNEIASQWGIVVPSEGDMEPICLRMTKSKSINKVPDVDKYDPQATLF